MRAYMTMWRAATEPYDTTGVATFTCRDKEVKFRMDNFKQYLALCAVIDNTVSKAEQRTRVSIFEHMNSYKE